MARYKASRTAGVYRRSKKVLRKTTPVPAPNILQHQRLVFKEAHAFARRYPGVDKDDLIQAGNIGLLQFAKRFRAGSSKFSTGATQAIRNKMLKEVYKRSVVRVPEKKLPSLARKGALPTGVALSEFAGSQTTQGGIDKAEARLQVLSLLRQLPPRERQVVVARTLQDTPIAVVAKRLRMSKPQVRKIEVRAFKKLKTLNP